jgi:hypothetical protein
MPDDEDDDYSREILKADTTFRESKRKGKRLLHERHSFSAPEEEKIPENSED